MYQQAYLAKYDELRKPLDDLVDQVGAEVRYISGVPRVFEIDTKGYIWLRTVPIGNELVSPEFDLAVAEQI